MEILISLLLVVIGIIIPLRSYKKLVYKENAYIEAFGKIQYALTQRHKLVVKFLDEVDAYFKDRQYDSLRELEKICKRAEDQLKIASRQLDDESLQSLGKVETELNNALWRIQLKIDADKTLKNDAKVLQWLDALDEEENNVALARRNYNRAAAEYNNLCSSFPTKWFAEFFGRRSQAFDLKFEDNVAIQASPKLLG